MRHVKIRRTPVVVVTIAVMVALLGLLLAGCGGVKTANDATTATTATAGSDTTAATGAGAGSSDTTAGAEVRLTGAGATFPEPLYLEWIGEFQTSVKPNVSINYQGIGSGGGIQQFTQMTVDFGASDAPMKDEEIAAAEAASGAKVLHIPTVFGRRGPRLQPAGRQGTEARPRHARRHLHGRRSRSGTTPSLAALNPDATSPTKPSR